MTKSQTSLTRLSLNSTFHTDMQPKVLHRAKSKQDSKNKNKPNNFNHKMLVKNKLINKLRQYIKQITANYMAP